MTTILERYQNLFEQSAIPLLDIHKEPDGLYAPVRYIMSIGGKRVRPSLVYLAADLFNGCSQDVHFGALAAEVFHNFTLLHDDIMDNADTRRGHTTVHKKYDQNTAILSGDLMSAIAYHLLGKIKHESRPKVQAVFVDTAIQICEGQQRDMDFESMEQVSLEDYMKMIGQKTGVLLACALNMGAMLGNASDEDARLLYDFGQILGLAFQVQDDFLDTFGLEAKVGKRIGGDIIQGKKTVLYVTALKHLSDNEEAQQAFIQLYGSEPSEHKVEKVTSKFREMSVDKEVTEILRDLQRQAEQVIGELSITEDQKQLLISFAGQMGVRSF